MRGDDNQLAFLITEGECCCCRCCRCCFCNVCFVKESDPLEAKAGLVFSSVFCSGLELMRLVVQLVDSKVVSDVLVIEDVVWAVMGRVEFGGVKFS